MTHPSDASTQARTTSPVPEGLLSLLRGTSICLIATINPDGSPQLTQTWADTDGENVLINTVQGFKKLANIDRDPRVAVTILDPDDTTSYYSLQGTVISQDTEHGQQSIETLSHKYTGGPYQNYGGRGPQVRVLLTIRVDKIITRPFRE